MKYSQCFASIVLFLTDGQADSPINIIRERKKGGDINLKIFTYAFGSGINKK